ncbi:Kynurenine formamidase [Folsomia candida]|uniref:Kynurenine formamidase n=1 Tax=Folsomia candida TaxID=158441 RepID=A0A226EMZ8_FOLCA|nr:Kynurenine formamidase [Folsomia candida]
MLNLNILLLLLCIVILSDAKCRQNHEEDGRNTRRRPLYTDLSYTLSTDTIFFPGAREFSLNKDYDGVNKSGIWYSAFSFCMGEHGGTHVDAPFHFFKQGWTLEQIPSSHLIDVPTAVIDVESVVASSDAPNEFALDVSHLIQHEKEKGEIPPGSVVLVHTGWSKYWPDKIRYLGIHPNAAKWLADERQIVGVGIDTPSVDLGNSKTFPVHIFLAERQIYNIENVANLHNLIQSSKNSSCELHLFVLPIKIVGATGAPARVLAFCK